MITVREIHIVVIKRWTCQMINQIGKIETNSPFKASGFVSEEVNMGCCSI